MTTDPGRAAHEIVATFEAAGGSGAWRLDRGSVGERLHQLVDAPQLVRQGGLNLCGPAALFLVWLKRDPVAAVTYATDLFDRGRGSLGTLRITASPDLRAHPFVARRCPEADWMMMAALRDSTNRVLRYSRPDGLREAAAAITLPGALRRWLHATGLFTAVRDETNLLRRGLAHARGLDVGPGRDIVALVAQEMLRPPPSALRRARDAVVALVPNHWVILRQPVMRIGDDRILLRFWSWGAEHAVELAAPRFRRCYFGALVAVSPPSGN